MGYWLLPNRKRPGYGARHVTAPSTSSAAVNPLLEAPILRTLVRFAAPNMLAMLATALVQYQLHLKQRKRHPQAPPIAAAKGDVFI